MKKGVFITLEGIEGCGKSTQAQLLVAALKDRPVYLTREPGGTAIGEAVREVLLNPAHAEMGKECELLLYAASRAQHVAEVIRPKLKEGCVVISDRYADATAAYQGAARGFTPAELAAVHQLATGGLQPQLTIVFDLPVETALERLLQRYVEAKGRTYDRIEQESLEFHERVRAAYLDIARTDPARVWVVDATQTPEAIHQMILARVQTLL